MSNYKEIQRFLILLVLIFNGTTHAQFADRALELGVDHLFNGSGFGTGLSLVDINGDGLDDLTIGTELGQSLIVYLQTDSGFQASTDITLIELTQETRGITWVDYDNDGDKDLFTSFHNPFFGGGFVLLNQDDDGHFTNVTSMAGLVSMDATFYGSTWADYNTDGYLDLAVNRYETGTFGRNLFYYNNGDGTFTEIASAMGLTDEQGLSFNSAFFDSDGDGDLDLLTTNDRLFSENRFYVNEGYGSYSDQSDSSGLNAVMDAMGIEIGDYDNDHDLDIYVTNTGGALMGDSAGSALFRNDGDNMFHWLTNFPYGQDVGTFWGCNFIDFDYDRDLDLFTVNGQRDMGARSEFLFINDGQGQFSTYSGAEFDSATGNHFATAQGDLNADGFLDLVVVDLLEGRSQIWIGPETENGAVFINLEGTVSNRDAIGSKMEVWANGVKRIDQSTSTNSHMAQDSFRYPFGLGTYPQADSITVFWPNGAINTVFDIPAGQYIHLTEDTSTQIIDCMPQAEWTPQVVPGLQQEFIAGLGPGLSEFYWTLNGEEFGSDSTLGITFPEYGSYEICLHASTFCTSIDLCEVVDVFCETPSPFIIVEQDLLFLNAELTTEYDSVSWTFSDGSVFNGPSIQHTFLESGEYELCVYVFDECGMDSLCIDIISDCPFPVAGFTYGTEGLQLEALNTSFGQDSIEWTWNGSRQSDMDSLTIIAEAGSYDLCLIAYNSCGSDSLCEEVILVVSSIENTSMQDAFQAYPNPIHSENIISLTHVPCRILSLTILNSYGQQLSEFSYEQTSESTGIIKLQERSMANGLYLIRIVSETHQFFLLPILKY